MYELVATKLYERRLMVKHDGIRCIWVSPSSGTISTPSCISSCGGFCTCSLIICAPFLSAPLALHCQVLGLEYCTSFGNYEYNVVAGLGHGASNELHSYQKEYSRRAVRGHFAVSFRGIATCFHRPVVAAATAALQPNRI